MQVPGPQSTSEVPEFLLGSAVGFSDSPEFLRLEPGLRHVPGLVMGQLTIWIRRLQAELLTRPEDPQVAQSLEQALLAVDAMSATTNPEIQNLVVVEVLEHLHGPPSLVDALVGRFGVATRALYARWVGRIR